MPPFPTLEESVSPHGPRCACGKRSSGVGAPPAAAPVIWGSYDFRHAMRLEPAVARLARIRALGPEFWLATIVAALQADYRRRGGQVIAARAAASSGRCLHFASDMRILATAASSYSAPDWSRHGGVRPSPAAPGPAGSFASKHRGSDATSAGRALPPVSMTLNPSAALTPSAYPSPEAMPNATQKPTTRRRALRTTWTNCGNGVS